MRYWLDLFTPETWEEARQNGFRVTGFRPRRAGVCSKIQPGDFFVCYLTRVSRFCGILEVASKCYKDESKAKQIWKHDYFPILLDTKQLVALDILHSMPK